MMGREGGGGRKGSQRKGSQRKGAAMLRVVMLLVGGKEGKTLEKCGVLEMNSQKLQINVP